MRAQTHTITRRHQSLKRSFREALFNWSAIGFPSTVRWLIQKYLKVFSHVKLAKKPAPEYVPKAGQRGKDVRWVPCSPVVLDKMLEMAKVKPNDIVFDPGSGDGRIAIRAAKLGALAFGVEANPKLVTLSEQKALKEGVSERASFSVTDFIETDFSKATVITLFLRRDLNIKLRPKILDMKPGTRVVSNIFDMGEWKPDKTVKVEDENYYFKNHTVHFWFVPAKVNGKWKLPQGELILNQNFQMITGIFWDGNVTTTVKGRMNGDEIDFTADGKQYTGHVTGDQMTLEVKDGGKVRWVATLVNEGFPDVVIPESLTPRTLLSELPTINLRNTP